MSIFDLSGKNIIVTGAARGNGLAIFSGLKKYGANVFGVDKLEPENKDLSVAQLDISEKIEVEKFIRDVEESHGHIYGLVNNAGVSYESVDPYTDQDIYHRTLEINLNAVFHITALVCKNMEAHGAGSIVNITSLGAHLGFPSNPSYQISKAGLLQLTKAFACDWGSKGIRLNNISPGYIRTTMTRASFENIALKKERQSRTMLGRWGEPEDLVGATIFLLSDASAYITGATIPVDGGWLSKGF